jgi:alginate O-acetyltransferase complex protein AlgI
MWSLAVVSVGLVKLATLRGHLIDVRPTALAAYLLLWPGMNARGFLRSAATAAARREHPRAGDGAGVATAAATALPRFEELTAATVKLSVGLALVAWTVAHAFDRPELQIAWTGMLGLILTLHFGSLHIVSWMWRRAGVDAPPIMRAPLASTSLAELWGERWNTAFADAGRRFLLRPLARKWGVRYAGASVFLASGLAHELVISLPARGGWGGPTAYFLIQAAGVAVEKSATGRRLGLGHGGRGWLWTFLIGVAPLPLLFHGPFAHRVIGPFYQAIANLVLR